MDFDDLDDEINNRIAEGDFASLTHISAAKEKAVLKTFVPTDGMTRIPRDHRLPASPEVLAAVQDPSRMIYQRAFLFYGPGMKQEWFTDLQVNIIPPGTELAVYEWPGHGSRADEPFAADLGALGDDAFEAIKPSVEEVCEGGAMEGAPFIFIGDSVGCQILTLVAKKVMLHYAITPSLTVVMNRAPLQFPLLNEEGKAKLESDPDEILKAVNYEQFQHMEKPTWINDLKYACGERGQFFHKFECDMMLLTADEGPKLNKARKSGKMFMMATVKVEDSDEQITLPVEQGTPIKTLRETLTGIFAPRRDTAKITFMNSVKAVLQDDESIQEDLVVTGLKDFKHPHYPWPHPIAIIGTGFQGVKTAMQYMLYKCENLVLFDRHESAGGDAWHNAATKHSKIQTDFRAFNIWFGHEYVYSGDGGFGSVGTGPDSNPRNKSAKPVPTDKCPDGTGGGSGVDYHPVRQQVLGEMQHSLEEYGAHKYTQFSSDVVGLNVVGEPDAHDRYYKLTVKGLGKASSAPLKTFQCSVIYHYPGAYDVNRIIDYPGEKTFGGQIGYGQGHDNQGGKFIWDDGRMMGARAAILGNGAFSIENARSCCEYGASKVYLITRRKSLACPRIPCWFCHQRPIPTPAWHLLNMFKPMYELAGMEDPWEFYAVTNNGPENAHISQSSRFGIGDVTFLCLAYGLLEYRVTVLERLSPKTMHLASGEKLENMGHIIKALGLLGDPCVDKLHNLKFRTGNMLNRDWRRVLSADPTGMHAANFTTFSAGPGVCMFVKQWFYIHNHPWEMYSAMEQGMMKIIPKHVISNTQPDQTVYMANVHYEMAAGGLFGNYFPHMGRFIGDDGGYKYCLIHAMHPTDKFLEYCQQDWDRYQKLFKEQNGCDHENIPYPYTKEMIQGFFDVYNQKFPFLNVSPDGPNEDFQQGTVQGFKADHENQLLEMIPPLLQESKLLANVKGDTNPWETGYMGNTAPRRQKYMASSSDSAMEFDQEQYDEWKNWMDSTYKYFSAEVSCKSNQLLFHQEVWDIVIPAMGKKSSCHNLPVRG